jgi:hypothetical protein
MDAERTESGLKKWWFTFCCGIDNPNRNCYTVIEARTYGQARRKMVDKYMDKWAFQYDSADAAGVSEFNLKEI